MRTFLFATLCLLPVLSAAATIDFEAQGTAVPSSFTGRLNSPLSIGVATFTGGQLLRREASATADTTVVYATSSFSAGGYLNPLVISFSQAVNSLSLTVTNALADTYTLSDNLGGSSTQFVGFDVNGLLSLTSRGATQFTLGALSPTNWNFAIDDLTYAASASVVPEPATAVPLAVALAGLVSVRKRIA